MRHWCHVVPNLKLILHLFISMIFTFGFVQESATLNKKDKSFHVKHCTDGYIIKNKSLSQNNS